MFGKVAAFYSLNKSRRVLRQNYKYYRKKASSLEAEKKERVEALLKALQTAIIQKNPDIADRLARSLEESAKSLMPKTFLDKARDFILAVVFALAVAISIRQVWFELYTIPSGSMRPTLKEGDLLLVSKTDYGINTLSPTSHYYFDNSLVKRGSIVIFSGKDMDIHDVDTTYFYLIPGKKQFVKRLIGKPGDSLYFYGGTIYGVSANGRDLTELREAAFDKLEHIPFISFDRHVQTTPAGRGLYSPVVYYQMNEPVAKLTAQFNGTVQSEMLIRSAKDFYDLWGFKNYGMARLLTPQEAKALHPLEAKDLDAAPLYLEITHHPSIKGARLERDEYGRVRPGLAKSVSLLPVSEEKAAELMRHMTTCRFSVKNGLATRYGSSFESKTFLPMLSGVPDGTYEIQNGVAHSISFLGISSKLNAGHPLLKFDPEHVRQLYNLGIEIDTRFAPSAKQQSFAPSRYVYFAHGDLYLMGQPIFFRNERTLVQFLQKEYRKQAASTPLSPYAPFDDAGAPLKSDGSVDVEFVRKMGLKVPDNMYLVLGDNHAMSGDSRQFGFVPQDNLRGGASVLLWPAGSRWGRLPQAAIEHFTLPNGVVLSFFLLSALGTTIYIRRKYNHPLLFSK